MLNVDLKQSSNAKICKRSPFKSLLNNQMLTHSPNVNYFHKVFKLFSSQSFSSEYCVSGVLLVLCKQIIRKWIAPTVTEPNNGCKYRNIQDLMKSNKTVIHSRLVIAIDARSASLVLHTLKI